MQRKLVRLALCVLVFGCGAPAEPPPSVGTEADNDDDADEEEDDTAEPTTAPVPGTGDTTGTEGTSGGEDEGEATTTGGGEGSSSSGDPSALSYELDIFPMFLEVGCDACHTASGPPPVGLSFDDRAVSYDDMIDVPSESLNCGTAALRVSPGSLEDSCLEVIFQIFSGSGMMSPDQVELGRQWILQGAHP